MNEIEIKENVETMIYEIRGKQVMLDFDLARLYKCANGTKTVNLAVKRHISRFPKRFMFQLTEKEFKSLNCSRFQSETLNNHGNKRGYNIKYLPYAFTEQGVAMLATILRTKVAEEVSIRIMDAFVEMRKYISNNLIEQKYINEMVINHDYSIKKLEESFDKMADNNNGLFFEGQIYDAYSLLLDIFRRAKVNIIIIDNYINKNMLDILRKINKEIFIITRQYNIDDISKYLEQYDNISVKIINSFHDRFIIIDENELYHCGASLKDLGKKCFAITKIKDKNWLQQLLQFINNS